MNKTAIFLTCFLALAAHGYSQNVFPVKIGGCNTDQFCLDCGDSKAKYNDEVFNGILSAANQSFHFNGSGKIMMQVLVDTLGHGCVLSHTDVSKSAVTKQLITGLSHCPFSPAIEKNKPVKSSVTLLFEIVSDKMEGRKIDFNPFEGLSNPEVIKK